MIIKFEASELSFQLTTDIGENVVDVSVGDYKGQFDPAQFPTVQNELMSVVQQLMTNAAKFKSAE